MIDDLTDSKRRLDGNNLINTLISSHININPEIGGYSSYQQNIDPPQRDSFPDNREWKSGFHIRKTPS
jgi:hypothetical protein